MLSGVVCLPSLLSELITVLVSRQDIKVKDFVLRDFHHCSGCFSVSSCELIFNYALCHCLSRSMQEFATTKALSS